MGRKKKRFNCGRRKLATMGMGGGITVMCYSHLKGTHTHTSLSFSFSLSLSLSKQGERERERKSMRVGG